MHLSIAALFMCSQVANAAVNKYFGPDLSIKKNYRKFTKYTIKDGTPYKTKSDLPTLKECVRTCEKETSDKCDTVEMVTNNGSVNCMFFKLENGGEIVRRVSNDSNEEGVVASKNPPTTGYCETLTYLNLCDKRCRCDDVNMKRTDYYCDCTKVQETFTDCKDALNKGFKRSGVFVIKPDQGDSFEAFCEMRKDGYAYLTWARLFRNDGSNRKEYDEYIDGFGYPVESHWIGLEQVHRLTKAFNFDLFYEFHDSSKTYKEFSYSQFKLSNQVDGYKRSWGTFDDKGSGLLDFFNHAGADATFGECLAVDIGGPSWIKTGTNGECHHSLFHVNLIIVSDSVDVHKVAIYLRR